MVWQQVACSLAACCCVRFLVGGRANAQVARGQLAGWQGESRMLRRIELEGSSATNRRRLLRVLQGT